MAETVIDPTAPVQGMPDIKVESTAPVVTPEPKAPEKDDFAQKLELLARKERAIYKEKQRIASERKQSQEALAKLKAWEESKSNAKKNPLDYLTTAGLSYDELTQFMLNGGKPTEEDKIESIRSEFANFKKQQEEEKLRAQQMAQAATKQQQDELINGLKEEIKDFVTTNADTYELISTRGAEKEVFSHLQDSFRMEYQKWNEEGKRGPPPAPMSVEQAVKELEEFYEKEVERLANTKKMQARYQPTKQPEGAPKKGPSPTLSNSMTSSAAASLIPAKNDEDRMMRALAKLGQ